MPFWRSYYHLVWATKHRQELITPEVEPLLFQYLTNKAIEHGMQVYAINGWYDHMHIVGTIPPKLSVADAVKNLKGSSSFFINEQPGLINDRFAWQRGYGVLTVGERHLDIAIAYVEKQKEHHQKQTTNGWLERIDPEDDGPTHEGLLFDQMPHTVRETSPPYGIDDPFPF